jgi:hypothetical protein
MTMPAQNPAAEPLILSYPRIVLMATENVDGSDIPTSWIVGQKHPLAPKLTVVAIFIHEDMVEIYSADGGGGMRENVPVSRVRLIREFMPPDVFKEELTHAEAGYPDDDDDELPDLEPDEPPENPQAEPS